MAPNLFWLDMLTQIRTFMEVSVVDGAKRPTGLLSSNFIYCGRTTGESLLVLSMCELPWIQSDPIANFRKEDETCLVLTAKTPLMVFTKNLKDFISEKIDLDVTLTQKFVDPANMYEYNEKTKRNTIKQVQEFLIAKVYCARVTISNSSETGYQLNVITEVPQGAVPVNNNMEYSKSYDIYVDGLSAKVLEYWFYFPKTGQFDCFRASCTIDGA